MTGKAVVIGASAGAVQALSQILPVLPGNFPLPVFVTVHVPPRRDNALVQLLAAKCALQVREAEDKDMALGGTIYLAPANYHLLVEAGGTLALSSEEPVNHSRPAIDVLFETAADAYGPMLAAIVLTGANHDGAAGLSAVSARGGLAIVQDPRSAEIATMPEAAIAACPTAKVMDLDRIAIELTRWAAA